MNHILNQSELLEIAGVKQPARLINWLNQSGIRYKFNARREVFTTLEQLNAAFHNTDESIIFGHGQKS